MIIFENSYLCLGHQFALGPLQFVLGKRVNRSLGYGLEIPVCFNFQGHFKRIEWVRKRIKNAEKMVQSRIKKCMKNAL